MFAFDVTPTTATGYDEKRGRDETNVGDFDKQTRAFEETIFSAFQGHVPVLKRQPDTTATAEELRSREPQRATQRNLDDDAVVEPRDARLALLARKYEGMASIEDTARLQILTERLRKLAPRVTATDLEQVAEMVADAEGIVARLAAVKEKFGLR